MPLPLAPAVLASLLGAAALDVDVALRAETRSSTVAVSGAPATTRASASAAPAVTAAAHDRGLRLEARYLPRLWSSDLEARPSPLVNHAVEARLEARGEGSWRAAATAAALRGRTDPLADLLRPGPSLPGEAQVATTEPLRYEALWASLGAHGRVGPRTTVAATAGWRGSRALGPDAGLLPPQHGASVDASLARALTERDTLRVGASSAWTVTGDAGARTDTSSSRAVGSWHRRLGPHLDGWAGAGAALLFSDPPAAPSSMELHPAGEVGLARGGEGVSVRGTLVARAGAAVDRFTGSVSPSVDVTSTLAWRAAERLELTAAASAGARTDGETSVARADGGAAWAVLPSLLVGAGVTWTWQHEREASRATFREAGAYVSIAWTPRRLVEAAPATGAPP